MKNITLWGFTVDLSCLSQDEVDYLKNLPLELPDVSWVWSELDRVWNQLGLDNKIKIDDQSVDKYYSHPVWLMNGIFTALDPTSKSHRQAIARYLGQSEMGSVADYGGGFGELSLAIIQNSSDIKITIIEPYPSEVGLTRIQDTTRIKYATDFSERRYDAVVAQDVLEHVEDPVYLAYLLASSVQTGGEVIFANCFYPVIQCHLPSTFHLRYTFPWVMKKLGLEYSGIIDGAAHAQVFKRVGPLDLEQARKSERVSRRIEPVSRIIGFIYSIVSSIMSKLSHFITRI